jgi:hypothetical protein
MRIGFSGYEICIPPIFFSLATAYLNPIGSQLKVKVGSF